MSCRWQTEREATKVAQVSFAWKANPSARPPFTAGASDARPGPRLHGNARKRRRWLSGTIYAASAGDFKLMSESHVSGRMK